MFPRWKIVVSKLLQHLGRSGLLDGCREPVLAWATRRLLDRKAIADYQTAFIRGTRQRFICDPYMRFHRAPYWFGQLHEVGLDMVLRRVLRPGDRLIDVGAHFGHVSALGLSRVGQQGKVVAIEANPRLCEIMTEAFVDADALEIHACGASDRAGEARLQMRPHTPGHSTLRKVDVAGDRFTEAVNVPLRQLDTLVAPERPGRTVVKIDVEGHEPEVAAGGRRVLANADAIAIEWNPHWWDAAATAELRDQLHDEQRVAVQLDATPDRPRFALVDVAQQQEKIDLLFAAPSLIEQLAPGVNGDRLTGRPSATSVRAG